MSILTTAQTTFVDLNDGYGVVNTISRGWTENQWNVTYGVGFTDYWSGTENFNCRMNDYILLTGQATDTLNMHTSYIKCDQPHTVGQMVHGEVVSHTSTPKGNDGYNNATIFLYKRSSSILDSSSIPTAALTYNFTNGSITESVEGALNGWAQNIPSEDGSPCYLITAKATQTSNTCVINTSDWSLPLKFVEGGKTIVSVVPLYYASTSSTSESGGAWSEVKPTWDSEHSYLFVRNKINYEDGTFYNTDSYYDPSWGETYKQLNDTQGELSDIREEINVIAGKGNYTVRVNEVLTDGINKVKVTGKDFVFDRTGLNISDSNSNISTKIDEDGMSIYNSDEEVLTADNTGVNARNLHATTYLIVGEGSGRSRFEDYDVVASGATIHRTACFWIGE